MEERRERPRTRVDWRVQFAPPGEDLSNGYLSDASASGMRILCTTVHPIGTVIRVHFGTFQEDASHHFQLDAVVRHLSAGQMGVQFVDGPVDDKERLLHLLRGVF
jgi:hypothetical protein